MNTPVPLTSSFPTWSFSSAGWGSLVRGLVFSLLALLSPALLAQNAPVAVAQSVTLDEDKGKVITLAGSDADAGTFLSYIIVTPPAHGSLTGFGPTRVYSPEAHYNGSDSFSFKVNDGALESPVVTVSLTINPVDEPSVPGPAFSKFVDPNPSTNNGFGEHIVALNTGNVVVTSPNATIGGIGGCGAVYLFNGSTGALISTLAGSKLHDSVGSGGVTALPNGNFVVRSLHWDHYAAEDAGAVTWGSGVTGINGVVSAANSLVGSTNYDQVGRDPQAGMSGVVALANSNYVVISSNWSNDAVKYAGAVTWGSGSTGVSGVVSAANSLVGTTIYDYVGFGGVTALTNGNYVVNSYSWANGSVLRAGAVTWGSGSTGVNGVVSAANSLVGTSTFDYVGFGGIIILTNGNYVVSSDGWDNGMTENVGAVTWGNGSTGISGVVSAANSLVGSAANDAVGRGGAAADKVTALANGNYVVPSALWDNGATVNVGAVTWCSGITGLIGPVSAANSLIGSAANDLVGINGVTALTNGNYVVCSREWKNGSVQFAGAVTWGNGGTGISGVVSTANSLVGTRTLDQVGNGGVTALANGNYVVSSPYWHDGSIHVDAFTVGPAEVGAATWCNGSTGATGAVSTANSLVGATASRDRVGFNGVKALTNGNYVVRSQYWRNDTIKDAGAVTWGNGSTGSIGTVSAANSLVGTTANENLGKDGVMALTNGNFVVIHTAWDNGTTANVGAVTWGNGSTGISGVVSAVNSLIGSTAEDQVGLHGVTPLTNGNYAVLSRLWDGTDIDAGAVTWGSGSMGISGMVSVANSNVGGIRTGNPGVPALDPLNNLFITGWPVEGKARLGSQENGFPLAPEMGIRGSGEAIADGDTIPSILDGTDFGSVVLLNTQLTKVFTIQNTGNEALNLTGTPRVTITGIHAADFTVSKQPDSPVTSASTTFEITFDPSLPGQRDATVSIASNDASASPYTFAITGFGALPVPLAQTITFSPPATVYLGQSPITLTATASSGLPVTFTVVSGPATDSGDELNLLGVGNVMVRATQEGGNNFAAAPAVTKTIAIKADPTALTLLDLAQTYDGTPKPISTIGASGAVITYSIGGVFGPDAPVNAGTYPVKAVAGAVTKTGSLVISKALLTVTPDNQHKFAGQPNPALTAVVTGYLGTDTSAVITKPLVLATTAKSTSPGGSYPITASGAAALNYNFRYQQGTMVIESFAGNYEALLVNAVPLPVAKLTISVTTSGTTFSAKLATATEVTAVSFAGPLITNPSTELATGTATTNITVNKIVTPYTITFTLPLSGPVIASATRGTGELGNSSDGRKLWVPLKGQTAGYAGLHTAVLEPATPVGTGVPAGAGWSTATINTTGTMSMVGRLGDGVTFTTALIPDGDAHPGYRLFIQPYKAARTQAYIAGSFALAPHPNPDSNPGLNNRRYVEQAVMTWQKTGLTADVSYRTNFGPVSTVLILDPWLPPVAAKGAIPATTLAQRLGLAPFGTTFGVTHGDTGSAAQPDLPTSLGLSATNVVSVLAPVTSPVNRTKWKTLTFKPADGTFTGSFELSDVVGSKTVLRPVTFSGVLRQPVLTTDTLIGDGHYLLSPLSGTERTTGEVIFTKP